MFLYEIQMSHSLYSLCAALNVIAQASKTAAQITVEDILLVI